MNNTYRSERQHDLELSSDPERLDLDVIHRFLTTSYWAAGIPRATVEKAVRESLVFAAYRNGRQVAFARFVTDRATFAYLGDVFVLPDERKRGVATALLKFALADPDLQGLRRILLVTRDAHDLYRPLGFEPIAKVEGYMEIWNPHVYEKPEA